MTNINYSAYLTITHPILQHWKNIRKLYCYTKSQPCNNTQANSSILKILRYNSTTTSRFWYCIILYTAKRRSNGCITKCWQQPSITHQSRANNANWLWVRWQFQHKWTYSSAVAYRLPDWNFERWTDCKTTCMTNGS